VLFGLMGDYSIKEIDGKVVFKVGCLEIIIDDKFDSSVLIRNVSHHDDDVGLRVVSKYSMFEGGFPLNVGYDEKRGNIDVSEWLVSPVSRASGHVCGNEVILGEGGAWYQHGDIEPKNPQE
jgi:hypothetical protein